MYRVPSAEFWGELMSSEMPNLLAGSHMDELRSDITLPDDSLVSPLAKDTASLVAEAEAEAQHEELVVPEVVPVPKVVQPTAPGFVVVSGGAASLIKGKSRRAGARTARTAGQRSVRDTKASADAAASTREKRARARGDASKREVVDSRPAGEATGRRRNSPYTPWTYEEDLALMERLQARKLAGQKLGERTMQELALTEVPQLAQRSFKAIYNRYNKHLQWRSKRMRTSLHWLREMHHLPEQAIVAVVEEVVAEQQNELEDDNDDEEEEEEEEAPVAPVVVSVAASNGGVKRPRDEVVDEEDLVPATPAPVKERRVVVDGARRVEGDTWLSVRWADGSTDWERSESLVQQQGYGPEVTAYYESLMTAL